jgi:2-keto-4-pentenoate hydratase
MGRSARWTRSAPGQHGVERAGEPVSVGVGATCLRDPHSATLWLAYTMAKAGRPLRAGDSVLSGALGQQTLQEPAAFFRISELARQSREPCCIATTQNSSAKLRLIVA